MPLLEILSMELFDDQVDIRNEKTPAGRMWKATLDSISRYNPLTIHWGVDITRLEMVLLLIVWPDFQKFEDFHMKGIGDSLIYCYQRQSASMRYVSDFTGTGSIQQGRKAIIGFQDPEQATGSDSGELPISEGDSLKILARGLHECPDRYPSRSTLSKYAILAILENSGQIVHESIFTPKLQVILQTHKGTLPTVPDIPVPNRVSDVFDVHPLSFNSQPEDQRIQFRGGPHVTFFSPLNECVPPYVDLVSKPVSRRFPGLYTYTQIWITFSEAAISDGMLKPEVDAAWQAFRKETWDKPWTGPLHQTGVATFPHQPRRKGLIIKWNRERDGRHECLAEIEVALAKLDPHIEFRSVELDIGSNVAVPYTTRSPNLLEVIDFVFLEPLSEADHRAFEYLRYNFAETAGSGRMISNPASYISDPPSDATDSDSDNERDRPFYAVNPGGSTWLEHDKGSVGAVFRLMLRYDSEDTRRLWARNYAQQSFVLMGHRAHALGQMPDRIVSRDMIITLEDFGRRRG